MSTQYQSKPVLTDALTGKLKNGESPHGYQKSQSDINSDETVILVKNKTTEYGYQLLDVNNSFEMNYHSQISVYLLHFVCVFW